MHNQSLLDATPWRTTHSSSTHPQHAAYDASKAPQPTGLTTAELRRIILDLLG